MEVQTNQCEETEWSKENATRVGTNPQILKRILRNLPDDLLLKYRHVSSLWNDLGSKTLLSRESMEILFSSTTTKNTGTSNNDKTTTIIHKKGNVRQTLAKLAACLEKSSKFPCVEFHFYSLNLESPELTQFFSLYGPKIRSLWLGIKGQRRRRRVHSFFYHGDNNRDAEQEEEDSDFSSVDEEEEEEDDDDPGQLVAFRQLLMQKVVNLESLSLYGIPHGWNLLKNPVFPSSSNFLPSLKSLQGDFRAHPNFTREILRVAINLERYEQPLSMEDDKDFIQIFMSVGKVKIIQILHMSPSGSQYNYYEHFACAKPHLREIKIELTHGVSLRSNEAIYKILESSQDSLIVVKINMTSYDGGKFPLIHWPKLGNVKFLFVDLWKCPESEDDDVEEDIVEEDSKSEDWTEFFPNLHELVWDNDLFGSDEFPFVKPSPTVRCLQLMRQTSPKIMEKLPKIFTRLEKLSLKDVQDFPSICEGVWGFQMLKSLYLGIDVGSDCPRNSFPSLDGAFTGFSTEVCNRLFGENEKVVEDLDRLRIHPSIVDMKYLRVLGLRFYDFDMVEKESYNFVTKVMGQHAIHLIGQLTVDAYCKSSFSKGNATRMVNCVMEAVGMKAGCVTGYPTIDQERRVSSGSSGTSNMFQHYNSNW